MADPRPPVIVVGAGLMGVGLVQVFAQAGHPAYLAETDESRRSESIARLEEQLGWAARNGLMSKEGVTAALARVSVVAEAAEALAAAPRPALVLEAVDEDLGLKKHLFRLLDGRTDPRTLLCTNTSGLSVSDIASACRRPERVCGMHFWNPPQLVPVVEVVRGERTAPETVTAAVAVLRDVGKTPVVCRDVPGFLGNRLLHALQREAMSLVSRGVASAADVDLVVTHGFGRRLGSVGPLAVCDLAGLDLVRQVDTYLLPDLEDSPLPSPLLDDLVARGHLGAKSGRGFHEWPEDVLRETLERRDAALLAALRDDAGRSHDPHMPK